MMLFIIWLNLRKTICRDESFFSFLGRHKFSEVLLMSCYDGLILFMLTFWTVLAIG